MSERAGRRSFPELNPAYKYAAGAASIQGRRWFVCKRIGRWYAIEPELADAVRNNPDWPGTRR